MGLLLTHSGERGVSEWGGRGHEDEGAAETNPDIETKKGSLNEARKKTQRDATLVPSLRVVLTPDRQW